jgi:predicted nucleic acid-binding Zn ribbon protein
MARHSKLRPMTKAFDAAIAGLQPPTTLASIQRAWPTAVGPAIAAVATPVAERGGVLTVSCSNAGWAQELDLMGESIINNLNSELRQPGIIKRIRPQATG